MVLNLQNPINTDGDLLTLACASEVSILLTANLLTCSVYFLKDRRGNEGMATLMGGGSHSNQEEELPALPPRVCAITCSCVSSTCS